ncbi:MAG: hypothetical protein ABFS46_14130 [Myxococcota bacterium]
MKRACALLLLLLPVGCVTHSVGFAAGERERPTSPGGIELLDTEPNHPYVVIGTVHAHCRTNWLAIAFNCSEGDMRHSLRTRAGELGADAIISVERTGFWQIEWSDVHLRGRAVRWLDGGAPEAAR